MMRLLLADTRRYWARRMSIIFPGALIITFVVGTVIAFVVLDNRDAAPPTLMNGIGGGEHARDMLGLISQVLPVMSFVIAASFLGADMKSGMLETLLTWEPRRTRLAAGRTMAAAINVGIVGALLSAVFVGLMMLLTVALDSTGDTTATFWSNVGQAVLRAGLSCALFAIFAIGVTFIVNSSLGSIVGFLVYWFIIEGLVLLFIPQIGAWLPIANAMSFASGQAVMTFEGSIFSNPEELEMVDHHGYVAAGGILAVWAVVAVALGVALFNRRDIA